MLLGRVRTSPRSASVHLGWLAKRFTASALKADDRKVRGFESLTIRHIIGPDLSAQGGKMATERGWLRVGPNMERSHSGLVRCSAKALARKGPGVRISHVPPWIVTQEAEGDRLESD